MRRDLIKRHLYLVPNSLVVSRGCPHHCDFCYKDAFFQGGRSFYTQTVDAALAEIERLPGRHLYFLDDNLFGDPRFAAALFEGMRGMGRVWQAAATVRAVLKSGLLEKAVDCGLRSLFVGFETLNPENLRRQRKTHNLGEGNPYEEAIRRLHALGVMVNGSFVFGMDEDDPSVFERTTAWAVQQGIETATFHILTPYPGTALHAAHRRRGTHPHPGLGPVRHAPRRLPARPHDPAGAGGGLLELLPRFLPLEIHLPVRLDAPNRSGQAAPPGLHRRLEEIRARLGLGHQG